MGVTLRFNLCLKLISKKGGVSLLPSSSMGNFGLLELFSKNSSKYLCSKALAAEIRAPGKKNTIFFRRSMAFLKWNKKNINGDSKNSILSTWLGLVLEDGRGKIKYAGLVLTKDLFEVLSSEWFLPCQPRLKNLPKLFFIYYYKMKKMIPALKMSHFSL